MRDPKSRLSLPRRPYQRLFASTGILQPSKVMETEPAQAEWIEVGASREELRYWRAKEAVRQAELLLSSQAESRRGFEARATALLGWIVAGSSLLVAASTTAPLARAATALVTLLPLVGAGGASVSLLWPGRWGNPGYDPGLFLDSPLTSELEELEAAASGYIEAIELNKRWLARAMKLTRWTYVLFAAAPVLGCIAFLVISLSGPG